MVNKWIFPLNKKLSNEKEEQLKLNLYSQLKDWNAHGEPIKFSLQIDYHQVLVIEAFTETSGCSIDILRKKVEEVLAQHQLEILPNHYVLYLKENELRYFDFRKIQELLKENQIDMDTTIIDTQKILAGETSYLSILRDTWLIRYC